MHKNPWPNDKLIVLTLQENSLPRVSIKKIYVLTTSLLSLRDVDVRFYKQKKRFYGGPQAFVTNVNGDKDKI